jgi:hypothetical protein
MHRFCNSIDRLCSLGIKTTEILKKTNSDWEKGGKANELSYSKQTVPTGRGSGLFSWHFWMAKKIDLTLPFRPYPSRENSRVKLRTSS